MSEQIEADQDKKINKAERKMKLIIVLIATLFVFISILYCYKILYSKGSLDNVSDVDKINKTTIAFLNNPHVLSVVTDINAPVPSEIGMPRSMLIGEYLKGCISLSDIKEQVSCLDKYYYNTYFELKEKKDLCWKNEILCLDDYYLLASSYGGSVYCDAISDYNIRQQCLSSIE